MFALFERKMQRGMPGGADKPRLHLELPLWAKADLTEEWAALT